MITCDTSVVVAAFARWHAQHREGVAALERADALIDHVAIETFSVLTRLPPPRRVPPSLVTTFLDHHFSATPRLPGASSDTVLDVAEQAEISGGAIYDLVVALAAGQAGATLLSLDRRAGTTYEAARIPFELMS